MLSIEKLNEFGADTADGLARCCGMEALYLRLVNMIPSEANFDKLAAAIEADDLDAAFEAAHALKGVLGNLSLTPMYNKAGEITELLRSRTRMDYSPLLAELLQMRAELTELCG